MSTVFDDTISEVHEQKEAAAAGATPVESTDVLASEGQNASTQAGDTTQTQTSDQTAESQQTAGEGAREGEGKSEAESKTTEDQFNFTGAETPEMLAQRHGPDWAVKFARRFQPLVSKAGGAQMVRAGAEIVALGNDPTTDGATFSKAIESAVGPSRWGELRDQLVTSALTEEEMPAERFNALVKSASPFIWRAVGENADVVMKGLLEDQSATLAEAREALADFRQWKGQGQPGQETATDPDDLSQLSPNLRKKLEDYDRLMQEVPGLRQAVTGMVERQKTEEQASRERQIGELGQELYGSVFSVVTERVNKLGLEPKPTDSQDVRRIKEDLKELFSPERLEAAFEADAERSALSQRALDKVRRLEKDGAFAYRDPLAVMAEKTFEEYVKSPRIAGRLADLTAAQKAQSTPKDPGARQEIVAGAPAAANPAERWKPLEGEDPFETGLRLAREKAGAAG